MAGGFLLRVRLNVAGSLSARVHGFARHRPGGGIVTAGQAVALIGVAALCIHPIFLLRLFPLCVLCKKNSLCPCYSSMMQTQAYAANNILAPVKIKKI